jgi:hypothetical protein
MKRYIFVFDMFLAESIIASLFALILYLINDPLHSLLVRISVVSVIATIMLGIAGYRFRLFPRETEEDY